MSEPIEYRGDGCLMRLCKRNEAGMSFTATASDLIAALRANDAVRAEVLRSVISSLSSPERTSLLIDCVEDSSALGQTRARVAELTEQLTASESAIDAYRDQRERFSTQAMELRQKAASLEQECQRLRSALGEWQEWGQKLAPPPLDSDATIRQKLGDKLDSVDFFAHRSAANHAKYLDYSARLDATEQECQRLRGQLEAAERLRGLADELSRRVIAAEVKPGPGFETSAWEAALRVREELKAAPIHPQPVPQVAEASAKHVAICTRDCCCLACHVACDCGAARGEHHHVACELRRKPCIAPSPAQGEPLLPIIKRHFRKMGLSEPTGSHADYDPLELAHERILAFAPDEPGSDEALRDITGLLCDAIRERCDPPSSVGFITRAELAGTPLTVEMMVSVLRGFGYRQMANELERAAKEQT